MLTIDGVLYHAVDINDMPENAVVFAAPNSNLTQAPYHSQGQQMTLDQMESLD